MTTFKAKVVQNIPANRLVGLGGINSTGDIEEGWETIYLRPSGLGWIPDFVSTGELEEGQVVTVTIKNNSTWTVEASEGVPAGTLVQCDVDGRVKNYKPKDGSFIGYTTHSAAEGELVTFVRKYGNAFKDDVPDSQMESFGVEETDLTDLTVTELKELAKEKEIEGYSNLKKDELLDLLEGD